MAEIVGYEDGRMEQWLDSPMRPPLTPPGLSSSPTPPRPRSSLSWRGSIGDLLPLHCYKAQQQYLSCDGASPLSKKSLNCSLGAPGTAHYQQLSSQPTLLLPVLPIPTVHPAPRPRSLLHQQSRDSTSNVRVSSSSNTHLSVPVALSEKPHDHGRTTLPVVSFKSPEGNQSIIDNRPASLKSITQGMRTLDTPSSTATLAGQGLDTLSTRRELNTQPH